MGVPPFPPLHVRRSGLRLRRALRRQRGTMAAGLAVTAAALAATAAGQSEGHAGRRTSEAPETAALTAAAPARKRPADEELVSAPVRIADAATVRLLRPGDRVDVIAAPDSPSEDGPAAEIVASDVRVDEVPAPDATAPEAGALVVLSVPRDTAAALAGAGTTSRLAVTLC
ncbi:RcpC/CpaB family pilus assembly protein [Streptomyces sp. NPDC005805]|uniref:RcpC/CpaB family pilus assembly protein n=1 Tax=Streptomyces sp. NPDC005805 TaxID=3157068 RepID=UPI0033E70501